MSRKRKLAKQTPKEKSRIPVKYKSVSKYMLRLRKGDTIEFLQVPGYIFELHPSDNDSIVLYGTDRVIVPITEIPDFDEWRLVAITPFV